MSTKIDPASPSKPLLWSSYILSGLAILFLIFDSAVKVIQSPLAVEPTTGLGYAANLVMIIGLIELACLILYVIPYTSCLLYTSRIVKCVLRQAPATLGQSPNLQSLNLSIGFVFFNPQS